MFKKCFLTILIATLSIFLWGTFSCAQERGAPAKRIIEIKVRGNYSISTATILNKLKIKPGDRFEESALNNEIKRLYAMGYFSDVFVETEDLPEGVLVLFVVVEKPIIESIEFKGNAKVRTSKLKKRISSTTGDLLDFSRLSQDIAEIRSYYIEQGYQRITIDYQVDTDPETGKAHVVFIIDEGIPLKVKTITIEGNEHIKSGELLKLMTTKTAWWFIRKGAFDDSKFRADLDRIAAYYRSKGFLDVRVDAKLDYSEDGKELFITVLVEEGNEYVVGGITVTGELSFPEKEIKDLIKMKSGDSLDYAKIKEDMERIRVFYYDRGYMDVEIDLAQKFDPAEEKMNLVYNITSHDEIYVGRINIVGNTKTRDKIIRREMRVYPGEKYDGKKLKKSKERIYNLGYFEDVYFETVPSGQKDVKNLNVSVKETKTGEFSFGGGYSSVDAWIGFVQIRQKNFDILDFPTFTGGGQDLVVRAELGTSRANYLLSWTDPWIFDYPLLFGFDVYRQEHDRSGLSGYGYDERRTGGDLKLGKEITDDLTTGLIYNLEEVKISNIEDNATGDLTKEEGTNWISRLTWNTALDKRDNKFSPTEGYYARLSLENAGGFLGGDKDFLKGWTTTSFYYSVLDKIVLELKGRTGLAKSYGDSDEVPIYERFFAGGAHTIRGYKERAVGPRDAGTNAALGGEAMVIGNAEVNFPIFQKIVKGAVFYDIGNVWGDYDDVFTTSGYKQGVGAGVRVKTPIGPLKLDWGYPLNKNHGDKQEGRFYFSVSHGF